MRRAEKRTGLLLVWTAIAVSVIFFLGASLLLMSGTAARYARRSADHVQAVLIGQKVMEMEKSNARFGTMLSVPEQVVRNGRIFQIDVSRKPQAVEGILLQNVSVTVTGGEETVTFESLLVPFKE